MAVSRSSLPCITSAKRRVQDVALLQPPAIMTKTQMTQNSTDRTRPHRRIEKAENADAVDCNLRQSLVTDDALTQAPHRCPQYCEWLWERYPTIKAAAAEADCDLSTMSRWFDLYGIREQQPKAPSLARQLRQGKIDPERFIGAGGQA